MIELFIALALVFFVFSFFCFIFKCSMIILGSGVEMVRTVFSSSSHSRKHNMHVGIGYGFKLYGYTDGVFHCEDCDVAYHYMTSKEDACHHCGKQMLMKQAKWDEFHDRWAFDDK